MRSNPWVKVVSRKADFVGAFKTLPLASSHLPLLADRAELAPDNFGDTSTYATVHLVENQCRDLARCRENDLDSQADAR